MTTSGTVNYTITAGDCIRLAFNELGVIGQGDYLNDYDYGVGREYLNLMLKSWQNFAHHLWVRQKVVLFLQKSQPTYEISLTSTDHIASDVPRSTTLSADALIGATTLTVTSSTGFLTADNIGIQLDDGTFFWSTIANVPSATSIIINNPLTSQASSGLYVFGYTTNLTTIFNISTQATRRYITSGIDTPLLYQSYNEYMNMPNKLSLGTPNIWSYDKQREAFKLNIWMTPANVSYYCNFSVDRKIQDINISVDEFDLPQEWQLAIMLNLATLLAPGYGKAQGDNFKKTESSAQAALAMALEIDNELGSVYIIPSSSNIRGRV